MAQQKQALKNPILHTVAKYASYLQDVYYIGVVILGAVAFFNPFIASLGVVALLLGVVWTLLDGFSGAAFSMDRVLNNVDKPLFFKSVSLVWLNFFALLTLSYIAVATPTVPVWTAFVFVGCPDICIYN